MTSKDVKSQMKSGAKARLIPVLADTSKENRATSVFLACLAEVDEFAKAMLGSIGQNVGKRAKISCFTEVVLQQQESKKDRPDGLIVISIGKRQWSALIESKIGNASLDEDQIKRYLEIAKSNSIDAVITISNQFAAIPTHHPIKIAKNKMKGVELFHWSWKFMLTQAVLLLKVDGTIGVDQAFVLEETVRYFRHESSGVRSFDRMNPEWKKIVVQVKSGGRLVKTSEEVENTVGSWHQEQRDLSLILTRRLGAPVSFRMPRAHRLSPEKRLKDDCEYLAKDKKLVVSFNIPDAAAPLDVTVDITRRTITSSMSLDAPKDRKTTKARVNWIVKQLAKADPAGVYIEVHWPGRAPPTQASLEETRADPLSLNHDNPRLVPRSFKVSLVKDVAGRFSGSRTFIEELEKVVPDFYERVGENLRQWVPPPPKIDPAPTIEPSQSANDLNPSN